jgi:hypothetical protein
VSLNLNLIQKIKKKRKITEVKQSGGGGKNPEVKQPLKIEFLVSSASSQYTFFKMSSNDGVCGFTSFSSVGFRDLNRGEKKKKRKTRV